jgi:hypothetical protein
VWLGGFRMPEEFSKANAKLPAPREHRRSSGVKMVAASQDLYPALFLLDNDQDRLARDAVAKVDGPKILCTPSGRG